MPGVGELPTDQPPHRQQSRRVRKIYFGQLNGLSTHRRPGAARDRRPSRGVHGAQAKRDALYAESREELKQKYEFGRMDGVA